MNHLKFNKHCELPKQENTSADCEKKAVVCAGTSKEKPEGKEKQPPTQM